MKIRIYTDTSVIGACEDEEFAEHSNRLMEGFVRGDLILVLSGLTVQELAEAPVEVRRRLASVPEAHIETLQLDAEAKGLAGSLRTPDMRPHLFCPIGGAPHLVAQAEVRPRVDRFLCTQYCT